MTSRVSLAAVAFISVVAVLPYLNGLSADFTFDDTAIIRDNPAVQVYPALRLLSYVDPTGSLYRPLTMLTYGINAAVSHDAFGYHLVNIALHALVSVVVFFLALRILDTRVAAMAAALLFATHPIHTEAVTNVVGRAELLAALGILVALAAFARAHDATGRRRVLWSAVSIAAFAGGLLAKESALTGLGLIAVLQWWIDRSAPLRQRIAPLLPYAALGAGYVLLRLAVVGALRLPQLPDALNNPLAYVDVWSRLRTAVIVLSDYVGLFAFPVRLSADYSFDQVPVAYSWFDPRFEMAAIVLICLACAVVAAARRAPVLILATLFTFVPLALTANVLFPIGTIKAERLLYLPSVGWVLACGWLVARLRVERSTVSLAALALIVAAYGGRAWTRNGDWQDNLTLFSATLRDAPDSAKAHFNAAVALEISGELADAIFEYRRTLDIDPDYVDAAYGICHAYEKQNIGAAAVYWCEEALHRVPTLVSAHIELGIIRTRTGELDAAEAAYRIGLQIEPTNPALLANLALIRVSEGDRWEAGTLLRQLQRVDTLDPEEHQRVAEARGEIEVALR